MITVAELALYPVKSCRQQVVASHPVDSLGLAGDRRWMIVEQGSGRFVTQRSHPVLVTMMAQPDPHGIILSAPALEDLPIVVPVAGRTVTVQIWDDTCQALDAGDRAAQWVTSLVGKPCRLVYMPDGYLRQVDTRFAELGTGAGFADGFPFLLLSEASLEQLNGRLAEPVPMKRFRPNIVVRGCEPYAEDRWRRIRIGTIEFSLVKPCTRCVMTTINTDTAERTPEPLATLASYRKNAEGIVFGVNMIHHGTGYLKQGMTVEVLE